MKIAIVGHEELKFTAAGKSAAIAAITKLLTPAGATLVSGGCHLGGVDIWAEHVALLRVRDKQIFKPANLSWTTGYKPRNLQIAEACDEAVCIVVKRYPDRFKGRKWPICYHCKSDTHIKSGGCWTLLKAQALGKPVRWIEIENEE